MAGRVVKVSCGDIGLCLVLPFLSITLYQVSWIAIDAMMRQQGYDVKTSKQVQDWGLMIISFGLGWMTFRGRRWAKSVRNERMALTCFKEAEKLDETRRRVALALSKALCQGPEGSAPHPDFGRGREMMQTLAVLVVTGKVSAALIKGGSLLPVAPDMFLEDFIAAGLRFAYATHVAETAWEEFNEGATGPTHEVLVAARKAAGAVEKVMNIGNWRGGTKGWGLEASIRKRAQGGSEHVATQAAAALQHANILGVLRPGDRRRAPFHPRSETSWYLWEYQRYFSTDMDSMATRAALDAERKVQRCRAILEHASGLQASLSRGGNPLVEVLAITVAQIRCDAERVVRGPESVIRGGNSRRLEECVVAVQHALADFQRDLQGVAIEKEGLEALIGAVAAVMWGRYAIQCAVKERRTEQLVGRSVSRK